MNINKLIIYCLLLIGYLGLSKALSPSELGINYVNNNESLAKLIPGAPTSVILTDVHSSGFLIKTYYHKYKIIYGFQTYEELIVRTSSIFKDKSLPYLGMSVFRRYAKNQEVNFTPLPPGSIFIGNKNFGTWKRHNSGDRVWSFFRVYRQIPKYLRWDTFHPSKAVFAKIRIHLESKKPFHGENNEFGLNGTITKKMFPKYFERQNPNKMDLKLFLRNYFKENFIK